MKNKNGICTNGKLEIFFNPYKKQWKIRERKWKTQADLENANEILITKMA